MPKGKPGPEAFTQDGFGVFQGAIGEELEKEPPAEKNPAAVALGRLGGLKGGKARAASLTPERRSEIARKAVQARWDKARRAEEKTPTPSP